MKKYYCYIKEYVSSANMAVKALIIIGFIALAETVLSIFFDSNQNSPSDVTYLQLCPVYLDLFSALKPQKTRILLVKNFKP